jgi:hypothetical protein
VSHKQLSLENWTEPDPTSTRFVQPEGGFVAMDGQEWARYFLSEELRDHVPERVRELFEVARGALLYGWFFYPLFQLGQEQLYRVLEAGAHACYHDVMEGPKQRARFAEMIDWLTAKGVIVARERFFWDAARHLRNIASHPERRAVMPPGQTLATLRGTAHHINLLFARGQRTYGAQAHSH